MAKSNDQKIADNLEAAIRSLYYKFKDPEIRAGYCRDVTSKEIVALKKQIKKRTEQLAKDPELAKLNNQIKAERCRIANAAKVQHERVDDLLRKFQVRGVSPELAEEVERMSNEKPAIVESCFCDDNDED